MEPLTNIKRSDGIVKDYPIYKDKDYCSICGIYFIGRTEKNFDLENKIQRLFDDINQLSIKLDNFKDESTKNSLNIII